MLNTNSHLFIRIFTSVLLVNFLFFAGTFTPAYSQQDKEIPVWQKMHYLSEEEMLIRSWDNRSFTPTDPAEGPVFNVAEFAPMQGVLIRYPLGIPYSLVAEMSEDIVVTTIVTGADQENTVKNLYQSHGVDLENCNFMYAPTDSYWTRDYGPWFIIDGNNEFGIVDFPYNRPRPNDDNVPVVLAGALGINLFGMDVVHTGGNYMTDFYGKSSSTTLVYTENADMSLQNPPLTPDEVDSRMFDYLGLSAYHVVEDPLNDYIEHIDCWGKFLDVDKVLIGQVPPSDPRYSEFEGVANYFEEQISGWGKPYEVYRVFTPGTSPGTPYTNSLILNDKVFVPQTGSSWDDEAMDAYQEAMPGYEIIGTYAEEGPGWQNTDAIHCRAKGIADLGMLWIRHMPLWGTKPQQDSYAIQATIIPLSGAAISPNSAKVYYKINNGNFIPLVMTSQNDTLYTASIPGAGETDIISYYLTVSDQSGRTANHPYIGPADPHQFTIQMNYEADIALNAEQIEATCLTGEAAGSTFVISNTGNMQLNFGIDANILEYKYYSCPIPDSPPPTAYSSNTFDELGWTEVYVGDDETISRWTIVYTWHTLYPGLLNHGSFWVQSPLGTVAKISGNIFPGTYTKNLDAFNGESMMGTWKIWIEDSGQEGGHQATGITMTLRSTFDPGPWLSVVPDTGQVLAGGQSQIQVQCDAGELMPGTYNGQLFISSNDPDESLLTLPVHFTVESLPYLAVSVDSLIYLNYDQMTYGQDFTVLNPGQQDILINTITKEGIGMFYWYIEPWDITLPYLLGGGDSLVFTVKVALPVQAPQAWMVYDTLYVESEFDLHKVLIGIDYNLISGTGNDATRNTSLSVYPNPFSGQVLVEMELSEDTYLKTEILGYNGQTIQILTEGKFGVGKHAFTWNPVIGSVPAGIYLLRISTEDAIMVRKLILIEP
ncbi:MAG TPA: agmatine deiminase family protein [Bacteroidales bacterium]|nr:agmatine deiminase family protein [Bacteroidales bacterium]HNS46277.1 agmatine deiminase family protein [Bacteroidales bacterium]